MVGFPAWFACWVVSCAAVQALGSETPPVAWGKPLAGGPVAAVILAPEGTTRDALELAQRLELDLSVFPLPSADAQDTETIARFRERLQKKARLIIIADAALARLPDDVRDVVFDKVKKGVGLVLTRHGADLPPAALAFLKEAEPADTTDPVTRGIGESLTPEWQTGLSFVRLSRAENGRMVELNYGSPAPSTHFLLPALENPLLAEPEFFDTYLSLLAKAARWAAGREPEIAIIGVEAVASPRPEPDQIPPELVEGYVEAIQDATERRAYVQYVVHFDTPAKTSYHVACQVRQPGRRSPVRYSFVDPLRSGDSSYTVRVRAGPGRHFLDLWIQNRKGEIVDWYTETVAVSGWPRITSLAFSRDRLYPNDTLAVSGTIECPTYSLYQPTFYVQAVDGFGRRVAETYKLVPEGGGTTTVRMALADLLSPILKIEAFAVSSQGQKPSETDLQRAAYRYGYLPVRQRGVSRPLHFAVRTNNSGEYNRRFFAPILARLGVDLAYSNACEEEAFYLASAGIRPLFDLGPYLPKVVLDGVVRVPSLADEDYIEQETRRLQQTVAALWGAESGMFSLGDGNCLAPGGENVCQSRGSLRGFQEELQEHYGDLATLNQAWGTRFERWTDVTPAPEEAASTLKAYAPWLDFRLYMDKQFGEFHKRAQKAIGGVVPEAPVGFNARPGHSPYYGYDWGRLASTLALLGTPPDTAVVEKVRSYTNDAVHAGLCLWHDDTPLDGNYARWYPWYAVLHGFASVWWADSAAVRALTQEGQPTPIFSTLAQSVREVNETVGAALRGAERLNDGIAVVDSQASRYLTDVNEDLRPGSTPTEQDLLQLVENLGYGYDFVTAQDLLRGSLDKYRLVMLPGCWALSDAEIQAIQRFHANGGHLLAVGIPGQFDEHGVARARMPLADLFGLQEPERDDPGQPGENSTIWKVARRGKTLAAFATAPLTEHGIERGSNERAALFISTREILEEMGLEPLARVVGKRPETFHGECLTYRYGKAYLVAVLVHPSARAAKSLTLQLKEPNTVYDALRGGKAPRPKKIPLRLDMESPAAVFCSLPYEVREVAVDVPAEVAPGNRLAVRIRLITHGGPAADHPVSVTFRPFQGEALRYYSMWVMCRDGAAEAYIPLALNERPGQYVVRARDALTGLAGEGIVRVMALGQD